MYPVCLLLDAPVNDPAILRAPALVVAVARFTQCFTSKTVIALTSVGFTFVPDLREINILIFVFVASAHTGLSVLNVLIIIVIARDFNAIHFMVALIKFAVGITVPNGVFDTIEPIIFIQLVGRPSDGILDFIIPWGVDTWTVWLGSVWRVNLGEIIRWRVELILHNTALSEDRDECDGGDDEVIHVYSHFGYAVTVSVTVRTTRRGQKTLLRFNVPFMNKWRALMNINIHLWTMCHYAQ